MMLLACGSPSAVLEEEAGEGSGPVFYAADTGGILEGTPEAAGVLKVASTLSRSDLQYKVGLTSTIANNINSYRMGDDGTAGTADDEVFETLRELDAIPYVNAAAFQKLLAYARANGYIMSSGPSDPFDPAYCKGTSMTLGQARSRFTPGEMEAKLGSYTFKVRQRTCHDVTGCSAAWTAATNVTIGCFSHNLETGYLGDGSIGGCSLIKVSVPVSGTVSLVATASEMQLRFAGSPFQESPSALPSSSTSPLDFSLLPKTSYDYLIGGFSGYLGKTMVGLDLASGVRFISQMTDATNPTFFDHRVTDTCIYSQATGREYRRKADGKIDGTGVYTEYHAVLYASYPASH